MRLGRWPRLLLLPFAAACDTPTAPPFPDGAERFAPPPAYDLWWAMTQECSGRRATLSGVRWYVVPGTRSIVVDGRRYDGLWYAFGNRIVVTEAAMLDGPLVRHEMLHALTGVGAHRRDDFLGRCGGVVSCTGDCLAEAGTLPPPDPGVARVGPEGLQIGVVVSPDAPSRSRYGGYFTMTVTARNPRNQPGVVTLPPSSDAGPSVSFEYRVEYPGGYTQYAARAWDDGVTRFAPGETKRHVFDFHIVGPDESTFYGGLRPGTYDLRGAYGAQWAPAVTITLSPP